MFDSTKSGVESPPVIRPHTATGRNVAIINSAELNILITGNMDPVIATLLGTLIGAVAGIAGTVWVAVITRKSEERRHLRQLAFEAGAKSWTLHQDAAKRAAELGRVRGVDPLEAYVLHSLIFSRIIEDGDLDRDTILKKWREVDSIAKAVHDEIRKKEGDTVGTDNSGAEPRRA